MGTETFSVHVLYRDQDGHHYKFIGVKDSHCQMHGEHMGQQAIFIKKRVFYSPKKGFWKGSNLVFDLDDARARMTPFVSIPPFANDKASK